MALFLCLAIFGNTNAINVRTPLPKNSTIRYWWALQPSTGNTTAGEDVRPVDVPRHRTFTDVLPGYVDNHPEEEPDDLIDNGNF